MKNKLLKTLTFLWLLALWQPANAQQWEEIFQINSPFEAIPYFYTADTGWIAVYQRLYYTTNGGESVQQVYQIPDSLIDEEGGWTMIGKIYPVSSTVAYMNLSDASYYGMYKTTDGGFTFTEWDTSSSAFFFKPRIYISEDTVVAYRPTPSSIVYSLDGGLTWNVAEGATGLNRGFHCFTITKEGVLWAFGRANNDYFYSTDRGLSWQTKPPLVGNNYVARHVSFLNEENAVMLTRGKNSQNNYQYYVYVTDDGFNTIKYTHDLLNFFDCREPVEIWYQKEDAIWLIHSRNIYLSTNGGESFEIYQPLNVFYISGLQFIDNTGYLGCIRIPYTGSVYKFVDTTTSVTSFDAGYRELSVFPNPAKNEINLQLPHTANETFSVTIVSLEGKTLFSSEMIVDALNPNITLPVHSLTTGIYLVSVIGDKFSATTKFIINR
jgi:photosystem II stability/assembly factor-like uncharacterized protein